MQPTDISGQVSLNTREIGSTVATSLADTACSSGVVDHGCGWVVLEWWVRG